MAKQKPIKVKRSNVRLYKKKKSALRRTVEIALFILVLGGIGFLGYCVAGPIIDYFGKEGESTASPWVPPEVTDETTTESLTTGAEDVPEEVSLYACKIPASALTNRSALVTALGEAKTAGYAQVMVELKDEEGNFCYKTQIDGAEDNDAVKGSLTLAEIVSQVKAKELTLIAEINTLKDSTSPKYTAGIAYRFADDSYTWLDAREEDGGKRWINPFKSESIQFYTEIIKELSQGGVDGIILKNTVYPEFRPYDEGILEAKFFAADRYSALVTFVSALRGTGTATASQIYIEAQLTDILSGYGSFSGTAEIFNGKNALTGFSVVAVLTKDDFTETLPLAENGAVVVDLPSDKGEAAASLFEYAADYLGDKLSIIPCIDSEGITAQETEKIRAALLDAGYKDVIIK